MNLRKNLILAGCLSLAHTVAAERVSVTVYNSSLGLVRTVRPVTLKEGTGEVRFQDVASQIDPTSVHIKSLTAPEKISVLEQNYEYDLVDSDKILSKYIDQEIQAYTKEGKMFDGKLLSSNNDIVLEKKDGSVETLSKSNIQNMDFPKLPLGLITRPTLVWTISAAKGGDHELEVSYLTAGLDWHAEYVAVLDVDDKKMGLSSWVSIDNKSGATYENAQVKLIAGELHRAEQPAVFARKVMAASGLEEAQQFQEKSFFEYHLYTLQRPATIKNNQIKQISLFPPAAVSVKKIYKYDGQTDPKSVKVTVEFLNQKSYDLGIPLPAGKVRVYKQDKDSSQEFVGEDRMDHTPKDEKVRISVGDAFDVVGERKQKDMRQLSQRSRQETYEIKLRNHKDTDIEIVAVEHFWNDWEITKSNFPPNKKDSKTAEFIIPVKKDGEAVLEYTAITRW